MKKNNIYNPSKSEISAGKKGSILIYILIVISFAIAIALMINENATENYEATYGMYFQNQAYIYATSGLNIVKSFLNEDGKDYDSKSDIWNNIPPAIIENGEVFFDIKPINKKININLLGAKTNTDNTIRIKDCVQQILEDENIPKLTPGIIKDWIDSDAEPEDDGREDFIYKLSGAEYHIKNKPLDTVMELALIDNYETYNKLKKYFTVYDEDKKLNVNFCDEETLKAYIPEIGSYAGDIIKFRESNEYKNISNIRDASYITDNEYIEAVNYLTVKSSLFYTKIIVKLADQQYIYHIVLKREGSSVKVKKFIQGYDDVYF